MGMKKEILSRAIKNEIKNYEDFFAKMDEILEGNRKRLDLIKYMEGGEYEDIRKKMLIDMDRDRYALKYATEKLVGVQRGIDVFMTDKDLRAAVIDKSDRLEKKLYDDLKLDSIMDDPYEMVNSEVPEFLDDYEKGEWKGIQADLGRLEYSDNDTSERGDDLDAITQATMLATGAADVNEKVKNHAYDYHDLQERIDDLKEGIMLSHITVKVNDEMPGLNKLYKKLSKQRNAIFKNYDEMEKIVKKPMSEKDLERLTGELEKLNETVEDYRETFGYRFIKFMDFGGRVFGAMLKKTLLLDL